MPAVCLHYKIYLEVGCKRIRQPHVPREGRQDQIPHLDTIWRNNITKAVMVITKELGEVMEEYQKDSQGTPIQAVHWFSQFCVAQKWTKEFE